LHGECPTPVVLSTGQPQLQAFPSPSTLMAVASFLPPPACLFIHSLPEGLPLFPSSGAFHMTATVTTFPLSKVAGQVLPLLPSPACLFIYRSPEGLPLPHSLGLAVPHPLCYLSFFFF
jgi:hypothetical protein